MNEQSIFLAAVSLENLAERSAYLRRACGGNVALQKKVEELLAAHERSGFLEVPVLKQMSGDSDVTQSIVSDSCKEVDLSYLSPSAESGSIGTLGHYTVLQVLGQGGFGTVLKAFDEKLQRLVAIKVLKRELTATSPPRKRFLREARSVAAIKHENVIAIYSVEEQPLPYFVMEFVDGMTLQAKMDQTGPIDVSEILQIGKQIALGLASAHALGLIHRDIKPANILLEQGLTYKVKLTDFGLARAADDASMTQSGIIAGTPLYMAPEQAKGTKLDARADLFSLGSVLYALTTGHPPFRAPSSFAVLRRVAEDTPRPIRAVISNVPDWLVAIIDKLLAKNPDDRFQSAQEVADILDLCQRRLQAGATTTVAMLGFMPVAAIDRPASAQANRRKLTPASVAYSVTAVSVVVALASVASMFYVNKPNEKPINAESRTTNNSTANSNEKDKENGSGNGSNLSASVTSSPTNVTASFTNSFGMAFMEVPKGSSWMGGYDGMPGSRKVEMLNDFMIGKHEVTQGQWQAIMGNNPSSFSENGELKHLVVGYSDADLKALPVEWVSWNECQEFVKKLNSLTKETGWTYRLPTPDEWEYACRGGPLTNRAESGFSYYYAQPTNVYVSEQANYGAGKLIRRTVPVGKFEANKLGLHDMHGNVWEWCGEREDAEGPWRVCYCGGCWNDDAIFGAQYRDRNDNPNFPDFHGNGLGFRVVRVPTGEHSSIEK